LAAIISVVLVLLLLSFIHMVLGEQTPKTIALRFPAQTAMLLSRPMVVFAQVAKPLVWMVDHSTASILIRHIPKLGEAIQFDSATPGTGRSGPVALRGFSMTRVIPPACAPCYPVGR